MKLLKLLKNRKITFFLSVIILFTSCNQYDTTIEDTTVSLSVNELKNIHSEIKNQFNSNVLVKARHSNNREFNDVFSTQYDKNLQIAQNEGVESLFSSQGLNTNLPSTVKWAINNLNNENFYEELLKREEITTIEDAKILFVYIQTTIEVKNEMIKLAKRSSVAMRVSSNCAWAVASTLVVTGILAGVTIASGGATLPAAIGFLAAKGWATAGIMRAC